MNDNKPNEIPIPEYPLTNVQLQVAIDKAFDKLDFCLSRLSQPENKSITHLAAEHYDRLIKVQLSRAEMIHIDIRQ